MKDIGIYVHIPFCKQKCNYCDFTSFCNKDNLIEDYIKTLKKEIKERCNYNYNVKTIYIGGGTPSYISPNYIKEILEELKNNFNIEKNAEISMELNPGTTNKKNLSDYFKMGINRLSIGLQTSNDDILKLLGRIHTFKEFKDIIKKAKEVGFTNINVDTMIGLPTQTIYDIEDTLNYLIYLNIPHISVYSLIIEPNTKLEEMVEKKQVELPDDEMERYMYWFSKRKLEENEYIHYEISNFSKIDYRCNHNVNCWNQGEYLGFGVASASYENNLRYVNTSNIEDYIKNIKNNESFKNLKIEEKQTKKIMMDEYMLLGLRKINGVNIKNFEIKFEKNPLEIYSKQIDKLLNEGLIKIHNDTIRLSNKGLDLANIVWEEFV